MKLACSTVFVCFNYSTSLSSDDFSSFMNSAKEARLLIFVELTWPALWKAAATAAIFAARDYLR